MYVGMYMCVCMYVCMCVYVYIYILFVNFTPRPFYPWIIASLPRIHLAGVVADLMVLLDAAEKTVTSSLSITYL